MITEIELLNWGICQVTNEMADNNEDSPTGFFLHSDSIQFLEKTDRIKSEIGLAFGIEYLLLGLDDESVETFESRIFYPRMVNPSTDLESTDVLEMKIGCIGGANFDYYKFEYQWEMQPGKWIFEISQFDQILLRKEFDVGF